MLNQADILGKTQVCGGTFLLIPVCGTFLIPLCGTFKIPVCGTICTNSSLWYFIFISALLGIFRKYMPI